VKGLVRALRRKFVLLAGIGVATVGAAALPASASATTIGYDWTYEGYYGSAAECYSYYYAHYYGQPYSFACVYEENPYNHGYYWDLYVYHYG